MACSGWAEREQTDRGEEQRAGRRKGTHNLVMWETGGVVGAVTIDGRVDAEVVVDVGGSVGGDAAAGLAADIPRQRRAQAPSCTRPHTLKAR
jgi:hypothetical protein